METIKKENKQKRKKREGRERKLNRMNLNGIKTRTLKKYIKNKKRMQRYSTIFIPNVTKAHYHIYSFMATDIIFQTI
jgi:hypothetical protein